MLFMIPSERGFLDFLLTGRKRTAEGFRFFKSFRRSHVDAFGKTSVIMSVILALNDIAVHAIEDVAVFTVYQYLLSFLIKNR